MRGFRFTPILLALLGTFLGMGAGCSSPPARTGFLSDYARLQPDGSALRYVDKAKLATYRTFIIEPVTVHFHDKAKGKDADPDTIRRLADYLGDAITTSLSTGYRIVSKPGPGVARVRVAITDIRHDTPALNVLPQTRMMGLGLGGASMEGEILDSRSGEQLGAVIQTQTGERFSLQGYTKWSSAEAVMDKWADQFRQRLDEAHGR